MQGNKRTYIIGEYEFATFHEYRDAQEDLRKIEIINRELDVHDPEVAIRLYNKIRDGEIAFDTPIGEDFFKHVADIVADKSVNLLDNKAIVEQAAKKARRQQRLGFAVIGLAIAFFLFFGLSQVNEIISTRQQEKRAAERVATEEEGEKRIEIAEANSKALAAATIDKEDPFAKRKNVDESKLTILPEYRTLYSENNDLVGWIKIDGTIVNYPVLQGDDNDYYLRRNFEGESETAGSIFMDYRSDIVNLTTNTIIYGHNMKSGQMFGELKDYLREGYLEDHKTISFDTIYEEREYEIVAVCLTQVAYQSENKFRYYNFIQAENEVQWQAYVDNVNALSVFSDDVDLKAGDEVLTLSTCNDYTEDGRLFLVAKRVN